MQDFNSQQTNTSENDQEMVMYFCGRKGALGPQWRTPEESHSDETEEVKNYFNDKYQRVLKK